MTQCVLTIFALQTGPASMRDEGGAGPQRSRGSGAGFHVCLVALSFIRGRLTDPVCLTALLALIKPPSSFTRLSRVLSSAHRV